MKDQEFIDLLSTIGIEYGENDRPTKRRKRDKRLYRPLFDCNLRGFEYFEGSKVRHSLDKGSRLQLVREETAEGDPCAVAVFFYQYKLGYIEPMYSCAVKRMLQHRMRLSAILQDFRPDEPGAPIRLELIERI